MEFENIQEEKKLFYLDGLGEGVYQIQIENLGSYEEKTFKKMIINKFDEYNSNELIDYFEIEFIHEELTNQIELNCNFSLENVLYESDLDIVTKIIYCENIENNVNKERFWSENNKLPYTQSVCKKLELCIPKVFNNIFLQKLNYLIRRRQVYFFN